MGQRLGLKVWQSLAVCRQKVCQSDRSLSYLDSHLDWDFAVLTKINLKLEPACKSPIIVIVQQDALDSLKTFIKRISIPVSLFLLVLVTGSVGYYLLWRPYQGSWSDAIYMTFITVTTVGYSEIHPINTLGRVLTVGVAMTGIGSLFYLFSAVMEFLVVRQLSDPFGRRRMQKTVGQLKDHVIVAGFGRMGQRIAEELKHEGNDFVIIDKDERSQLVCHELGYLLVVGDAEEDDILEQAGIRQARALIAAIGNDAVNAFVVMSARSLNTKLLIVAKADEDAAMRKLLKAGANRTINPYAIAGQRLVNMVFHPVAIDFMSKSLRDPKNKLHIKEFYVPATSTLVNKSLKDLALRSSIGINVIAIIRDNVSTTNPSAELIIEAEDHLIILANEQQLESLQALSGDVSKTLG